MLSKEERDAKFPYVKLQTNKFEQWANIKEFYEIDSEFPEELLYFQQDTSKRIVMISPGMVNLLECKRRHKLHVVNIGLKLFQKNRDDKSECNVSRFLNCLVPFSPGRSAATGPISRSQAKDRSVKGNSDCLY